MRLKIVPYLSLRVSSFVSYYCLTTALLQIFNERATPELSDWDRYAKIEYQRLAMEEDQVFLMCSHMRMHYLPGVPYVFFVCSHMLMHYLTPYLFPYAYALLTRCSLCVPYVFLMCSHMLMHYFLMCSHMLLCFSC